jgi:hypothetical protein
VHRHWDTADSPRRCLATSRLRRKVSCLGGSGSPTFRAPRVPTCVARLLATASILAALLAGTPAAEAAGTASPGFAVSDFATGFPTGSRFGPLGVAFDIHGTLFAIDNTDSNLYRFSSAGSVGAGPSLISATPIPGYLVGLTFDKAGNLFVARQQVEGGGDVAQLDTATGAVIRTVASGFLPLGIATDPVSGDLFVTRSGGPLIRIANPTAPAPTVSDYGENLSSPDGIDFGPDGTLYLEDEGNIISVTGTAAPVSGVNATLAYVSQADGIAVAETTNPTERPFLAVNSNDGTITKVDLATTPVTYTPMVTGGSRGDLVAVGPDRCLYATQFDSIEKVTASDGTCPFYPSSPFHCSTRIGAVSPAAGHVPIGTEPGTTVTITGKSFCPGTKVQFGSIQGSGGVVEAQVQSTGQMTATVPRDAASGPVSLISPEGPHGPAVQFPVNSYRNTDAFSFANFGSNKDVSWQDVADAFGANAYQTWSLCNGCAPVQTPFPTSGALAVYKEINNELKGGLCFGFSLGSLRFMDGLDPLVPMPGTPRTEPQWRAGSVYGLPTYLNDGAFGDQLRHYLYQKAMSQFSVEHYDAVSSYLEGLRHLPLGVGAAQYLYKQIANSFTRGFGIVEFFTKKGGHALVPYALEPRADGSFDIDVYDSNQPFLSAEVTDGVLHDTKLSTSQIHIDSQGNWSFLMGGLPQNVWTGPPAQIHFTPMSTLSGSLTPNGAPNPYFSRVTSGASVTQVTDAHGRSLFDAHGELVPEQLQPEVAAMTPLDSVTAGGPGTWTAAGTVLVLGSSGPYTETVAPGQLHILGAGVDGQISTTRGAHLRLGSSSGELQLSPVAPGAGSLELTRHDSGGETTISASGKLTGQLTLNAGRAITVSARAKITLTLTIRRVGPGRPPQTFAGSVRLGAGQKLELGSLRGLDPGRNRLHATVSGHGRHRVTLTNRALRPVERIIAVAAKRVRGGTRVTVRLVTGGARGGQLVVTVRGAGHTATTVQIAARSRVTVSLMLSAQRRGQRLRVWAVALTRGGQAGRTITGAVRLR